MKTKKKWEPLDARKLLGIKEIQSSIESKIRSKQKKKSKF